jgi:hypothetical protein
VRNAVKNVLPKGLSFRVTPRLANLAERRAVLRMLEDHFGEVAVHKSLVVSKLEESVLLLLIGFLIVRSHS